MMRWPLIILLVSLLAVASCSEKAQTVKIPLPDTLVVGTLYSPTGFFIMRGDTMGYDYDRVNDMARAKGMVVRYRVARNLSMLINWLHTDSVDLVAASIPITAEYRQQVLHCGAVNETHQVLVQHTGDSVLTDVTQLPGREVYVEKGSKYEARLHNLDGELGGGIVIHTIAPDTITPEDLIEMVSSRQLPLTVVDSDIAQFNHTYYDSIDISLAVSFPQRSSWAVNPAKTWLADSVNAWSGTSNAKAYSKAALKRYFELNKHARQQQIDSVRRATTPEGWISPYDDLFRKYSEALDWDWRMLAAIAYTESRFDPDVTSWAGARGLMQLMPSTAKAYGLSADRLDDPDASVCVAVKSLIDLKKMMADKVSDPDERVKFILAAYNAGAGHIYDAIALAAKHGKDPQLWDGNVEEAALWKTMPEYYNDEVCRFGYFRGRETVNYVAEVLQQFHFYQEHFALDPTSPKEKKKSKNSKRK